MSRSSDRPEDRPSDGEIRRSRPLVYALNRLVVVVATATLVGLLLSAIFESFAVGAEIGLKSLAAAALPPIILTYSSFFSRSVRPQQRALEVNLFVIALIWILVLLILVNFITLQFNHAIPLGEFLLSLTLSGWYYFTRRLSTRSQLSGSYGILSGLLLYLLIFGLPSR